MTFESGTWDEDCFLARKPPWAAPSCSEPRPFLPDSFGIQVCREGLGGACVCVCVFHFCAHGEISLPEHFGLGVAM